jgi:hypothetical protein
VRNVVTTSVSVEAVDDYDQWPATSPPSTRVAGRGEVVGLQNRGDEMSERLEILKKARERMTEDRDGYAKVLAAPFDRDKAERARNKFIEIQMLIDALNRAISGEEIVPPTG